MPTNDVIVAGAGPVGPTLAIDLGRRGVRCLIIERSPTTLPYPKMGRSNARTMGFYERERPPIGRRNVDAAGWAADGVPIWRAMVTPEIDHDTPAGATLRSRVAACFDVEHRRMHGMVGVAAGYPDADASSPLIADQPGADVTWETSRYEPKALPDARIPHMWLADGQALQDILGDDYTLLDLRGDADTSALEAAFRACGAPLSVIRRDEKRAREIYGASVFLLRPDLHIAWRGDGAPSDAAGLAALATAGSGRQVRSPRARFKPM